MTEESPGLLPNVEAVIASHETIALENQLPCQRCGAADHTAALHVEQWREQLRNLAQACRELAVGCDGLAAQPGEPPAHTLEVMREAFKEVHTAAVALAWPPAPFTVAQLEEAIDAGEHRLTVLRRELGSTAREPRQ